ncbi:CoA-binding protein [Candidatus Micrarchaeota archaeon]|nr:MAG: CoA-binding protein [Candidatus Micrarchaeota archaeon]
MKSEKMRFFFKPKRVAVIGVNRESNKIGHTVFRNMIESFKGDVFPVNPNADEILGHKVYRNVQEIPYRIDLAIITVPANLVPEVLKDCGRKGVKAVVVISSGFGEIGEKRLENRLLSIAKKYKIYIMGPNCIGIYDSSSGIDTLFLPRYKLRRPEKGNIAFITQSGAIGGAVLDWMAYEGLGFSKFVSYGNAVDVNEADILEYLENDPDTKVIVMYIEGTKNGRRLMEIAKRVSKKKVIIAIKAGRTKEGLKAVVSHTASLGGEDRVYEAAFKQSGIIRANTITEAINFAKAFVEQPLPKGNRVLIITNGGGLGVMATDAVIRNGLELSKIEKKNAVALASKLPHYAAINNPLDIVGDADSKRYSYALEYAEKSDDVDVVLCIALMQAVSLDADIIGVLGEFNKKKKKPLLVCTLGGEYTKVTTRTLQKMGIPCYKTPTEVVKTISVMNQYAEFLRKH